MIDRGMRHLTSARSAQTIMKAALLLFLVCSGNAAVAEDDRPWERLPDGRVIIEIKGRKLGLPSTSPDTERILFHARSRGPSFTLREVIDRPLAARQIFRDKKVEVLIQIDAFHATGLLNIGNFLRSDFRSFQVNLSINDEGSNVPLTIRYLELSNEGWRVGVVPEVLEGGWQQFREVNPKTHETISRYFVRSKPAGEAPMFLPAIICAPFLGCEATSSIGSHLGLYITFSDKLFPISTWLELDKRVRALAAFILISETIEGARQ